MHRDAAFKVEPNEEYDARIFSWYSHESSTAGIKINMGRCVHSCVTLLYLDRIGVSDDA